MARALSEIAALPGRDWIEIDAARNEAIIGQERVHFSRLMLALLAVLVTCHGRVATDGHIISSIWGIDEPEGAGRVLRNMIWRLRKELAPRGYRIVNYAGSGYELMHATSHAAQMDTGPARAAFHR